MKFNENKDNNIIKPNIRKKKSNRIITLKIPNLISNSLTLRHKKKTKNT